jgi:hypothetical protein
VNPLDVQGDLEIRTGRHGASVRIPLAEPGDWLEWMNQYAALAKSQGLEATVAPEPGNAVLTVKLPGNTSREQAFELLDTAVGLIDKAKADTNDHEEIAVALDQTIREWWSTQRSSAS